MRITRIVALLTMLLVTTPVLADWPTPADHDGPNLGAGIDLAQVPAPSPTNPGNPISGAARAVAQTSTPGGPHSPDSGIGSLVILQDG
jgi:hypothetical protein